MSADDFNQQIANYRKRIESVLAKAVNTPDMPSRLQDAMSYSCLNGGKRVRALLVYAAGEALDARLDYFVFV